MEILDKVTYTELAKQDSETAEAAANTFKQSPLPIFVG